VILSVDRQVVAIVYPDTFTAALAMEDLEQRSDLGIRGDDVAAIMRDEDGIFTSYRNAVIATDPPAWTMFWWELFATLFFRPLLGMPMGSGLSVIVETLERSLDPLFVRRVRDDLSPGTSAVFVVTTERVAYQVADALDAYCGTVLQSGFSPVSDAEAGEPATPSPAPGVRDARR
jgi:uncharacterized membrane protein